MVKTASLIWLTVALCLVSLVVAKENQLNLEDIEQDNISVEKAPQPKQQLPQQLLVTGTLQNLPPRQYFASASPPPPPPPAPTPAVPPQESTGPHQFSPDARQFPPPPPLQVQFPSRIPQQQLIYTQPDFLQYFAQSRIGGQEQQYQFELAPSSNTNNLLQDQYLQQYFAQSTPQQYIYVQPQASNNIPVQTKPENLGGIQYVQFLDPSTELLRNPNTHALLADPHQKSSHNLAGLLQRYAHTNTLPVNYRQPAPQTYRPQGQAQPLLNQNVYVVPQVVQPVNANLQPVYQQQAKPPLQRPQVFGQQRFLVPGITYVNNGQPAYQPPQAAYQQPQIAYQQQPQVTYQQQSQPQFVYQPRQPVYRQPQPQPQQPTYQRPQFQQQEAQQSIANIVYEKRAPKSLLDSYVPSVLQIQYYKQLQEQQKANALRSEGKSNENIVGKTDYQKNLAQTDVEADKETAYEYQYQ